MAEVSYIWNGLDTAYSTSNDVALFGYADGWNDGGKIIVDAANTAYALSLNRADSCLSIGGDYSSESGSNIHLATQNTEKDKLISSAAAVSFAGNGLLNFVAQSGAGSAGSVDGGTPANLDENIRIESQYTVNTADVSVDAPAVSLSGIDAQGKLDVIGSVTGTIDAALTGSYSGYKVQTKDTTYSSIITYTANASNRSGTAAAIQVGGALTIGTNFQANLNASSSVTMNSLQDYVIKTPIDTSKAPEITYATAVTATGNTTTLYGISAAGGITGDSCVWQGNVDVQNTSAISDSTSEFESKGSVLTVTVTDNKITSYGVQTAGDMVVDRFLDSSWNVLSNGVKIKGETTDPTDKDPTKVTYSTLTVQNNAISATGIAAANLTAVNGAENLQMTVASSGDAISGSNVGSKTKNTVNVRANTISVAGIDVTGSVTIGGLSGVTLNASATGDTTTELRAAGIQAQTVSLGDVDEATTLSLNVTGNKLVSMEIVDDVHYYVERIMTERVIQADTLTMGDYEGSIELVTNDNSNVYKLDAAAVNVTGTFSVHSLKGSVSASENGNAIPDAIQSYAKYDKVPRCTLSAIKAGSLTVDGVFSTAITVKAQIYSGINPIAYNAAVDVSGKLTASAFSGTINPGISEMQCCVGLQARGGFYTTVNGDLFDVNGGIYAVDYGITSASTLNLRVSGEISASKCAIRAESNYSQGLDNFTDDFVEIASSAKITGAIELGGGDNKLLIDSGATIDGNILATKGRLSLFFELDEVNDNAVISTNANDVTLNSTVYVSINLNNAENDEAYTLFQFDSDVRDKWSNRRIAFVYDNDIYTGVTDENGHLVCYNDDGSVKSEFTYNDDDTITVTVTGAVNPEAFDTTLATTAYDAENTAFTIDWSQCSWDIPEIEQGSKIAELEYRLKDASGASYGESITVRLGNGETSYTIQGVLEGEEVSWRLRYSADEYHYRVSGWSDTETVVAEEEEEPAVAAAAEDSVPDVSQCNLRVGDPDDRTKPAGGAIRTAVARLYWDKASSETPIENYTVEYVEIRKKITDPEEIKALFTTETVYAKEVTGTEVLVSGLTNGSYVYWRLKAEDVDEGESEYTYGQTFQVSRLDETPPELGDSEAKIRYTHESGELGIHADITWEAAADIQSGVAYYTVEYAVNGTGNWTLATTQNHDETRLLPYSITIDDLENENYSYRITAYDYCGNTAVETVTDALPKDATAPAQGNTYSQVWYSYGDELGINADIAWDAATDTQSGVKSYTVEYALSGTENWTVAATVDHVDGQSSYVITINGLANEDYTYRITAYDYCDNASEQVKTDELKKDSTAPEMGNTYSQRWYSYAGGFEIHADIAWDAATDTQSGVKSYTVEYALSGTENWTVAATVDHVDGQSSYAITVNGLANEDYTYRITAYDYCGNASVKTVTDGLKKDTTAPVLQNGSIQTAFDYYTVNNAAYYLRLNAAWLPGTDVGSGIQNYLFTYWDVNSPTATQTITVSAADVTSYGVYAISTDILYNGETYNYQLTAVDYCGNVSNALTGSFGGDDVMAPTGQFYTFSDPVIEVTYQEPNDSTSGTALYDSVVTFSWNDSYTDTMSPVCYKLQFSYSPAFDDAFTYTFYNVPADGKSFVLNNAVPTMSVGVLSKLADLSGGMVYWRVMAMDNPGNDASYALVTQGNETGIWSPTQSFKYVDSNGAEIDTNEDPAEATNLTATNSYSGTCYVSGTTLSCTLEHTLIGVEKICIAIQNNLTAEITSRVLDYGTVQIDGGTGTSSLLTSTFDLEDGLYTAYVRTYDAYGKDSCSEGKAFLVDTTRPTTVTGIQISNAGNDLTVSWDPSFDASGISKYVVAYRYKTLDDSAVWNYTASTQNTFITLFGMADAEYEFAVYAYDAIYSEYGKTQSNRSLISNIVVYSTLDQPVKIQGDLNRDGRSDVLLTHQDGYAVTWLVQEDQTVSWNYLYAVPSGCKIFATGYTETGKTTSDVYLYNSAANELLAWTTNSTGSVSGVETIGSYDAGDTVLGLGDFDGDGQSDVLLRSSNGTIGYDFTSDHTSDWQPVANLDDGWNICAICDLNGDGTDDLLIRHVTGFADALLTQQDGTVAWVDVYNIPTDLTVVGSGDFNGDGTDDVLVTTGSYYGALLVSDGRAYNWMGLGDLNGAEVEQIADYNGDGVDDLRIRSNGSVMGVELVMGENSLQYQHYATIGNEWETTLASI